MFQKRKGNHTFLVKGFTRYENSYVIEADSEEQIRSLYEQGKLGVGRDFELIDIKKVED